MPGYCIQRIYETDSAAMRRLLVFTLSLATRALSAFFTPRADLLIEAANGYSLETRGRQP